MLIHSLLVIFTNVLIPTGDCQYGGNIEGMSCSPIVRLFLDELLHQRLTVFALQHYHLDSLLLQVLLASNKGFVFA